CSIRYTYNSYGKHVLVSKLEFLAFNLYSKWFGSFLTCFDNGFQASEIISTIGKQMISVTQMRVKFVVPIYIGRIHFELYCNIAWCSIEPRILSSEWNFLRIIHFIERHNGFILICLWHIYGSFLRRNYIIIFNTG